MAFAGFSEEDIRKFTDGKEAEASAPKNAATPVPAKKTPLRSNSKGNSEKSKRLISRAASITLTSSNNEPASQLPEAARLSQENKQVNGTPAKELLSELPHVNNETLTDSEKEARLKLDPVQCKEEPSGETQVKKKVLDLDEFEARQKLIEEQNRKRKELLAKALADRTKRTQEEARRLGEIQSEFKKLDASLSNDVRILRKQIESASVDYLEAEKKYRKIEKEFLDAKLVMHQRLERKEMLTEHLCAIIEKNEERKAEKLTELLQKLQMDPSQDELEATMATADKELENGHS